MKILFTLLIFSTCLLMASRKKETVGKTRSIVMKSNTVTTINGKQAIVYNPDGTPASIIVTRGSDEFKRVFSYRAGKINYSLLVNNKAQEEGEYLLVNGKIGSFKWMVVDNFGDTSSRYTESFVYNEKGLLRKHTFNGSWSEYSYDGEDNMIGASHYNSQGQPTTNVTYTYTRIKDLFPAIGLFNADGSGSGFFLPAFSNYLPASRKVTRVSSGQVTQRTVYTYQLDKEGYLVKGRAHIVASDEPDTEWTNDFK